MPLNKVGLTYRGLNFRLAANRRLPPGPRPLLSLDQPQISGYLSHFYPKGKARIDFPTLPEFKSVVPVHNINIPVPEPIGPAGIQSSFSAANIIHQILAVESPMFVPYQVSVAYEILDGVLIKVKERIKDGMEPEDKLKTVYKVIEEEGLRYLVQDDPLLISCLLAGNLDCDASSFIVLAIGQELGWPISLVESPKHVFVRWEEGQKTINIDYGVIHPDDYYICNWFQFNKLRSLERDEIIAITLTNRGYVRFTLGQYAEASADYDEALRLYPSYALGLVNRGVVKFTSGKYLEAIVDYDQAIRRNPIFASAFWHRGQVYSKIGQLAEALADLNEAIGLDPRCRAAFLYRGEVKIQLGQYAEAIADLNVSIQLADDSDAYTDTFLLAEAFWLLYCAKTGLGKHSEARDDLHKWHNFSAEVYYRRGRANFGSGQYEAAIADFDQASRLDLKHVETFCQRARAKLNLHKDAEAIADLDQAIRLEPNNARLFDLRGYVNFLSGQYQAAIADFDEVIRLDPEDRRRSKILRDHVAKKLAQKTGN